MIEHVRTVAVHFERRLRTLLLKHPIILEVRGEGVMRGLELRVDAAPIVEQARLNGLLVNRTNGTVVRLLPPLTIEAEEIDRAVDILDAVFASMSAEVHA